MVLTRRLPTLLRHNIIFMSQKGDSKIMSSAEASSIYDFTVNDVDGKETSMDKYKGFVTIVVNVATECGYTKNGYTQLQGLYTKYAEKGLRIAAFPCNQFGSQEPKAACEVKKNMGEKFNVTFDIYDKIDVNGNKAHPLFAYLKKKQGGTIIDAIKWNFTKFLVDRKGQPIKRYGPSTEPNEMEKDIVDELEKN